MNATTTTLLATLLSLASLPAAAETPSGEAALPAAYALAGANLHATTLNLARIPKAPVVLSTALAPASWKALLDKVRAHGAYTPSNGDFPATYGLADLRGPVAGSHLANYINEWGNQGSDGVFGMNEVSLVSEDWKVSADGNRHIDQWLFQLTTEGDIVGSSHNTLVEDSDGRVLSDDTENIKDGDPRIKAKCDQLLGNWAKFQPKLGIQEAPVSFGASALIGPRAGFLLLD